MPFTISEPVTIKAIATYGVDKSAVVEAVYTIKLRAPAITYTKGLVVKDITLTSIAGASIRYTISDILNLDFSEFKPPVDPTTSTGTEYTAPFGGVSTKSKIVKAIAYKDGFTTSDVGFYQVVAKKVQVPVSGSDYDGDGLSDTERT